MARRRVPTLAIVLLVVGIVLVGIGLTYFMVAADKLPSILGQIQHATAHRSKRGMAALVLGLVSLGGAWWAYARLSHGYGARVG